MTIHWLLFDIRRNICKGHLATIKAHAIKITFLTSVWLLVNLTASPKQPQSLMGLKRANHKVIKVINAIKTAINLVTTLL